jgi:hypothetical protein
VKMATCQAVTSAGRPCACKARDGFATCGRHKNAVVDPTVCGQRKADRTLCQKKCVEGDTMCKLHRTIADRREMRRRAGVLWNAAIELLWGGEPLQHFNELVVTIEDNYEQGWITQFYRDDLYLQLAAEWEWYRRERVEPIAHAVTDLQRLALDNQNVHTKEVNQQTTAGMKYLFETSVPDTQETLAEVELAWTGKVAKKVLRDMKTWYGTKTCVTTGDYLYKRMLDGLWARIKTHAERTELTERLWEEAFESVGMCCQGHISRLTNVLIGFTEDVNADVPTGEILQQKIAAIAAKEVRVEYKVCEAWAVFEELKIPMEERDAWIEAF